MTAKERAIVAVLMQRADAVRMAMRYNSANEYLAGKLDGYMQAVDLVSGTLESVSLELEEKDKRR